MAAVPGRTEIEVLHVDDEPDQLEVAEIYLEREHERLTVETTTCAEDGLEMVRTGDLDCIVSDYDMPGTNGLELLEQVRREYPDLPFILFTGKGSEEIASEAISAGVTDYLQKGVGTDQYEVLANRIVNAVERYRAEQELERYETVVEAVDDLVYAVDDEGRFLFVNEAQESMTGYSRAELLGEHVSILMEEESRSKARTLIEELRESDRRSGTFERTAIRKDGAQIHCEDHLALLPAPDGEFHGTAGIVREITDRKRRERALERQQARLEEVAEVVSEDLDSARDDLRDVLDRLGRAEGDVENDLADVADRIDAQIQTLQTLTDLGDPVDSADRQ